VLKDYFAVLYYHSYSLTTYVTVWSWEAFLLTTVIPLVLLVVVNAAVLMRTLRLSPLKFLRRDLSGKTKKRVMRLSHKIRFLSRFRMRVIFQNVPSYIILFVGILFANWLLLFGFMMSPLLQHYKGEVLDSKIADYQYILKMPVSTSDADAEKYCITSLNHSDSEEEITIYGIAGHSEYISNIDLPNGKNEVVVSDGYIEKYGLSVGGTVTLKEKYSGKEYTFKIAGSYYYPAALAVFMDEEQFKDVFDKDDDYFTGYFSNRKLSDIDDLYIASTITEHDLVLVTDQLEDSMGMVFPIMGGFAILLYMLMIYMLSKLVLEKNANAISMVKILGYNSREIGKLYITSTAWVVLISLIVTLPIDNYLMHWVYNFYMMDMNGWMSYYVAPKIYAEMFAIGVVSYLLISLLQYRRISRIPMEEALKNNE
jgi:putative ABC transport system permease protein